MDREEYIQKRNQLLEEGRYTEVDELDDYFNLDEKHAAEVLEMLNKLK